MEEKENRDKFNRLIDNFHEGYYEVNLKGDFIFLNSSIARMVGYSKEEGLGTSYKEYMSNETAKKVFDVFHQVYQTGEPLHLEYEILRRDGTSVAIENSVYPLKDARGNITGFYGLATDITERKRMENALRRSEEKYRTILESIEDGYYEVDLAGNLTFFNNALSSILGYSSEEMMGMNNREFMDEENASNVYKVFNMVFRTGLPSKGVDWEIIRKDGRKRYIEASVSLVRGSEGRPEGFRGIVRDVTERKLAEKMLESAKTRFESLFENANEMIITTDAEGYILRVNRKVLEISGYSREELIGESILKLAPPGCRGNYIGFWKDLLDGKEPRKELKVLMKSGEVIYILVSGSVIRDDDRIMEIQYNVHDITHIKKAQDTILRLKDRLNSIIESNPNLILCLDSNHRIVMANLMCVEVFELGMNELEGKDFYSIDPRMERYRKVIEDVEKAKKAVYLPEEKILENTRRVFGVNIYPLSYLGQGGQEGGVVFTAVDVTDKKDMELKLIHAQKMETIGELASGFAHDFNNMLTVMMGNLSMLRLSNDDEGRHRYLDTLENITGRARDLVQQLLTFSKKHDGKPEDINLGDTASDVIQITSKSVPKNIEIVLEKDDGDYVVRMDRTQLTQVLLNLIVNAKDAIGDKQGGRIGITLSEVRVDKETMKHYLLPSTGRFARLDVTDNGCGIDKEDLSRVFDPFFTTKTRGSNKGTGLGLAITYNLVKNAGGSITVYSEKGIGTRFAILLPVSSMHPDKAHKQDKKDVNKQVGTSRGRILLVDDEDMIRCIGEEMLSFLGYDVVTAKDGNECIDILKRDGGFDLVILDMIMPGLDGVHTLDRLERENMDVKVVLSSGFSFENEGNTKLMKSPLVLGKLNKPFNLTELSEAISGLIGQGS